MSALNNFNTLLEDSSMTWECPKGFQEAADPTPDNPDVSVNYAVVQSNPAAGRVPIEVRYHLCPARGGKKDPKNSTNVSMAMGSDPSPYFLICLLNICNPEPDAAKSMNKVSSSIGSFPPEAVRREFGAAVGLTAPLPTVRDTFSTKHNAGMATMVHHPEKGTALMISLYENDEHLKATLADGMDGVFGDYFHSWEFN
eukprot:TRINITY_DN94796_c0_g1_i1.p1 TRINITY_DN94796_c0_g1~~TRINITY_DN94796_c0_g1_i1.p1  ORF type:complete len:198 (-),score=22.57 TRINITY_DN94796_c0_g1_i1:64-657(-)